MFFLYRAEPLHSGRQEYRETVSFLPVHFEPQQATNLMVRQSLGLFNKTEEQSCNYKLETENHTKKGK